MLLYAAEVWGNTQYESMEKTHIFACKKLLGVSARTPNSLVYAELNRHPLYIDSQVKVIKYWHKLLELDALRIPRQAYEKVKKDLSNTFNWGYKLKKILDEGGFSDVWLNQGQIHINSFAKSFKQRQIDIFWQNWHSKIVEKERFSTYRQFKTNHQQEDYLNLINISKFRRIFTRTHFGIIDINTNKKFTNLLASNRCPFCRIEESEIHIITSCTKYEQLREKYIQKH